MNLIYSTYLDEQMLFTLETIDNLILFTADDHSTYFFTVDDR